MAEPFETLREVGVALDGFRSDVSGQFGTLKWIIGGVTVVAVGVSALLFNKVDRLEEIAARNTAILERIEKQLGDVAAKTTSIRDLVQTANAEPKPGSFVGYVGMQGMVDFEKYRQLWEANGKPSEGWIYLPQK